LFETPILLIIFNRPDTTQIVFNAIRQIQPRVLFVAADGPRNNVPGDIALCEKTRKTISNIDWDCEVNLLFSDTNQGCGYGVSSAIDWFFNNTQAGIILEDDCLPNPTFFRFCEELLSYYQNDLRVMHISGNNFLFGKKRGNASYYFSRYTYNWGWATWRRAWKFYDANLVPEETRSHIWDAPWRLSVEKNNGLSVLPNINLVTNIGCGRIDATHTTIHDPKYDHLPSFAIDFPLIHPKKMERSDSYLDYSILVQHDNSFWGAIKHYSRVGKLRPLFRKVQEIIGR